MAPEVVMSTLAGIEQVAGAAWETSGRKPNAFLVHGFAGTHNVTLAFPREAIPSREVIIPSVSAQRDAEVWIFPRPGYHRVDNRSGAVGFLVRAIGWVEENGGGVSPVVVIEASGPVAVQDDNASEPGGE
jgi:hypothetical protein